MNQRAIQSSYKKYTGSKHSLCKQKIQFLLKISIIMNLRLIQCPCNKEDFIPSLDNQEMQYLMKFSTITHLKVSQCHCKKEKDFIHSLWIQEIQFLLNFSNNINLWIIQCPCKKQTSYILSEIRQCTAVTNPSAMHIPGMFCVRIKNAEWLMWENDTLRNDTCNTITHCLYEQFTLDQKKLMILAGKWCIQERWIEVSLHLHTLAIHFYVHFIQTKTWKTLNFLNIILDMYKVTKVVTVNL